MTERPTTSKAEPKNSLSGERPAPHRVRARLMLVMSRHRKAKLRRSGIPPKEEHHMVPVLTASPRPQRRRRRTTRLQYMGLGTMTSGRVVIVASSRLYLETMGRQ